ncbi:MAG: hypothetical protein ABFD49_08680 [Armatimonadota bacterium]|nr:hypothetical protein [bacterium]
MKSNKVALLVWVLALILLPVTGVFAAETMSSSTSSISQLLDNADLTLCYAHSFSGDTDGIIGKLGIAVGSTKVNGNNVIFKFDVLAIPDSDDSKLGIGGSIVFGDSVFGANLGVGYMPGGYGWSWNATVIKISL